MKTTCLCRGLIPFCNHAVYESLLLQPILVTGSSALLECLGFKATHNRSTLRIMKEVRNGRKQGRSLLAESGLDSLLALLAGFGQTLSTDLLQKATTLSRPGVLKACCDSGRKRKRGRRRGRLQLAAWQMGLDLMWVLALSTAYVAFAHVHIYGQIHPCM